MEVIGEVAGKHVIIVDDIIDTGWTLTKSAEILVEQGALSINAYCTHGILSGNAIQRIAESKINKLVISDTIPHQQLSSNIEVMSCADLLVSAIDHLLHNKSVKEIN